MKANKLLVVMGLIAFLLACHNNAPTNNTKTTNDNTQVPQENQKPTFILDENINKLTAHAWQFEKGENLTQEWLIKMDNRATLEFYHYAHSPNDLNAPTPNNAWEFLSFSSYAGCASLHSVIGLDKTQAKFYQTGAGYFGDAPYCDDTTQMEGELATFVGSGNIKYEFKDNYLILRDNNNQTLFFKKKQ